MSVCELVDGDYPGEIAEESGRGHPLRSHVPSGKILVTNIEEIECNQILHEWMRYEKTIAQSHEESADGHSLYGGLVTSEEMCYVDGESEIG